MKKTVLFLIYLLGIINLSFSISFNFFQDLKRNTEPKMKITREEKNRIGKIEFYSHNQILKLVEEEQKILVYSDPFSSMPDDIIFTARKGDEVKVTHVLYSPKIKSSCLLVTISTGKAGFIPLHKNPYGNGQFTFKEDLMVNGKTIKILNLNRKYTFEGFSDNPAIIYSQPDINSETIVRIYDVFRVDSQSITADYNWLYVIYENYSGWINKKYLCDGIGGPVLNSPEEIICEELLWADYR